MLVPELEYHRFAEQVAINMNIRQSIILVLLLGVSAITRADVDPDGSPEQGLKLIELYTSHGCSSCPPADALLGELLESDDQLLALEYHVDYWNTLVHGSAGSFTDPFSNAEYSMRQREYNAAGLKGRPGVYTPQAVINGRFATVGSNRRHITKALDQPVKQALSIKFESDTNQNALNVSVTGSDQQREALEGTSITIAYYLNESTTRITGGENSDKTLVNHHIVTQQTLLGKVVAEGEMTFRADLPADAQGCVVMVQERAITPVYAAAACP